MWADEAQSNLPLQAAAVRTLRTATSSSNSMKAKRMAVCGSPHTLQSMMLPHALNTSASCASVTCTQCT